MPVWLVHHKIDSISLRIFSIYSNGSSIRLQAKQWNYYFHCRFVIENVPTAIDEWHSDVQIHIVFWKGDWDMKLIFVCLCTTKRVRELDSYLWKNIPCELKTQSPYTKGFSLRSLHGLLEIAELWPSFRSISVRTVACCKYFSPGR